MAAGWPGLAATYSPAPWGAVPSALGVFTAEFGMGSGVLPPAMATRPGEPAFSSGDRCPCPRAAGSGRCTRAVWLGLARSSD